MSIVLCNLHLPVPIERVKGAEPLQSSQCVEGSHNHFCVDYHKLNDVTYEDAYFLPRIDFPHEDNREGPRASRSLNFILLEHLIQQHLHLLSAVWWNMADWLPNWYGISGKNAVTQLVCPPQVTVGA